MQRLKALGGEFVGGTKLAVGVIGLSIDIVLDDVEHALVRVTQKTNKVASRLFGFTS